MLRHYAWVTKRLLKGLFVNPEGWPENSPVWRSSLSSYRVLQLCHQQLTPRYRELVANPSQDKVVYHLTSPKMITGFLDTVLESIPHED